VLIVVFDVTKRTTLTHEAKKWVSELNKNTDGNDILLVLVGNKIDIEDKREVEKTEAEAFAKNLGAFYWEASAKTGVNVEEIFTDICSKLDENEQIKKNLVPNAPIKKGRLTVVNHSGREIESDSDSKSRCCK